MRTPAEIKFDRLHGIPSQKRAEALLRAGLTIIVDTREGLQQFEINRDRVLFVDRTAGTTSILKEDLIPRVLAVSTLCEEGESYVVTASPDPDAPSQGGVVLNEISQRHLSRVLLARAHVRTEKP